MTAGASSSPYTRTAMTAIKPAPPSPKKLSPKKLLLSKWTAIRPVNKERHFLVIRVIEPEPPSTAIADIELQAVLSGRVQTLHWRALSDQTTWLRGWL